MKIATVEAFPVSVPYKHREVSTQVQRDGVTSILIRVDTTDGLTGWGEACTGSDAAAVLAAVDAMKPFFLGADPWDREAIRARIYWFGLWQFQAGTANFAYAGIEMALWDICGKAAKLPLYQLLGGAVRSSVNYFCYLARGTRDALEQQCADGLKRGYTVFYLKVGLDDHEDLAMVRHVRQCLGDAPLLRLDANGAWSGKQARAMFRHLSAFSIDFVEQPVRETPIYALRELRTESIIAVCANEGLWSAPQAYERIRERQADVYCFSTYWVGGLTMFQRLAHVAALEGLLVCKHTHGELALAAAASQHVLLTLPNVVKGNQQTSAIMDYDIAETDIPIAEGPDWGLPEGTGLGVRVNEEAVAAAAETYRRSGQFLPYQAETLVADVP